MALFGKKGRRIIIDNRILKSRKDLSDDDTVSYTHLDVYKRQPWERENMNLHCILRVAMPTKEFIIIPLMKTAG